MDAELEEDARDNHKKILGKKLMESKDRTEVLSIIEDEPQLIFGLHKTLQDLAAFKNHSTHQVIHEQVRGVWLYGQPGCGKTWSALHDYQKPIFNKAQNKWWCGYEGEPTIVMDDVDFMGGQTLGHYLKIWGDKYPFSAEVKGGKVHPEYTTFVVTSNYTIRQLFTQGAEER